MPIPDLAVHVAMNATICAAEVLETAAATSDDDDGARISLALTTPPSAGHLQDLVLEADAVLAKLEAERQDAGAAASWARPVLIFVPVLLGLQSTLGECGENYMPFLQLVFSLPQCVGIIGGKPRAAHFFVGVANERLLYLDPHSVQPALTPAAPDASSCHHKGPSLPSMPLQQLDPSLAFGFLCREHSDFESLCGAIARWRAKGLLIPFSIMESPPRMIDIDLDDDEEDSDGMQ